MTEEAPSNTLIDGKYQLLRLIGRGGMGSVWEGRHVSLGTRVAVKFIDAEHANSPEARLRFDNEARAAATLQSKYAIQIHDHGMTTDGRPFIVMELLGGEALDKRLERAGTLSLQETAHILQQVCKGLQRAHDRGIIHRDLKPENIFLVSDEEEGGELVKVLDFGIAKMRTDGLSISNNTRTGAILGTPYYMSPEQARGLRDLDHRSDLWSLGVIAFRCLIGRLPFEGESVGDLLVKICTSPLPVPSDFRPDLPPAFNAWFFRTLERDPAGRFGSALELSQVLCDVAGVSRVSRGSGMDAYHALHRAAISSSDHKTLPATMNATPNGLPLPGHTPNRRPSYSGPGPISGTPLPSASVTSAGLSSSTANYRPSRKSGRGLIIALAALFALVGALGALVVYLAFIRQPEPPKTFATSQTDVTPDAVPTTTATVPLALPDATLPVLATTATAGGKPGGHAIPKPTATALKPGATAKPPGVAPTAPPTATATAKPPVVPPPNHSGHASGI